MGAKTAIEWTATVHPDGSTTPGATWNPIRGDGQLFTCAKVSPGCAHCYAERLVGWLTPHPAGTPPARYDGSAAPRLSQNALGQPGQWRTPRKIFVCSMTDLFWDRVPDTDIMRIWAIMAGRNQHTYLVLTKRPQRMHDLLTDPARTERIRSHGWPWPLPNVRLGVTVENQRCADERITLLLQTPAALRFISCEPLLGPINLDRPGYLLPRFAADDPRYYLPGGRGLDWVIAGGESGGPADRRLVERCTACYAVPSRRGELPPGCERCAGTGWAPKPAALQSVRSLRDQCQRAGVAFFFKQWGGQTPKSGGATLDGREYKQFPQVPELPPR